MPEERLERGLVAMRVQPQPARDGEVDDALDLARARVLGAEDVEFAYAAPVDAARQLLLDQRVDRGVAEPRAAVGAVAVRADERHHARRPRRRAPRRVDERARAVVRARRREDRAHAVLAEQREDARERERLARLVVVVQVRVEDRPHRPCDCASGENATAGAIASASAPASSPAASGLGTNQPGVTTADPTDRVPAPPAPRRRGR